MNLPSRAPAIRFGKWLEEYTSILSERGLKPKTFANKNVWLARLADSLGNFYLHEIETFDISEIIRNARIAGTPYSAQTAHSVISDVFREAHSAGMIRNNPALPIIYPTARPERARLTFTEWQKIYNAALSLPDYAKISILLAIVTAQRRSDIAKMQRADIKNGYLHVIQQKSGRKIAIPLAIRLDAIGLSLGDVISMTPEHGHIVRYPSNRPATASSLSYRFLDARRIAYPDDNWLRPPTFHEQRSLSERLYRSQGINTMELLGHKYQRITDDYHDNKNREWTYISV